MSIRRMGIIFGLALVVGSIISMWLPESESKIEEQLFGEITYQMSELKLVTDTLVQTRNTVSGTMQQQIDDELQPAAEWLTVFMPTGETHEDRMAYLIQERDRVTELVKSLGQVRDSISQSNISTAQ
jgi:glycosyltransferase A (GT-A) superfamily protein (DUF2064 family)